MRSLPFLTLISLLFVVPTFGSERYDLYYETGEGLALLINNDETEKVYVLSEDYMNSSGEMPLLVFESEVYVFRNGRLEFKAPAGRKIDPKKITVSSQDTLMFYSKIPITKSSIVFFKKREEALVQEESFSRFINHFDSVAAIFVLVLLAFSVFLFQINPFLIRYYFDPLFFVAFSSDEVEHSVVSVQNILMALIGVPISIYTFHFMVQNVVLSALELLSYSFMAWVFLSVKIALSASVSSFIGFRREGRNTSRDVFRWIGVLAFVSTTLYCVGIINHVNVAGLLLFTIALMYFLWLFKVSLTTMSSGGGSLFYFFCYLCTLEILPYLFASIKLGLIN